MGEQTYAAAKAAIDEKRREILALRDEMRALQAAAPAEPVNDYELAGWDGPVRLSELFRDKDELIVVHNMGRRCAYCTMWADGFNGVYGHLASRAAFVVTSPDDVETQKAFASGRGWRFPMASHAGASFAEDLGYWRPDWVGRGPTYWPGVSALRKGPEGIVRVADASLGPYDDFCAVYHLFALLPGADAGWEPRFVYA